MLRISVAPLFLALIISVACPFEARAQQYWDGNDTSGNGVVNGGSGTWTTSSGSANWTTSTGTPNSQWANGAAVFTVSQGSTGTFSVSLPSSLSATNLTFQSGGYIIAGTGTLTLSTSSTINVIQGADTINTNLIDSSLVTKTGVGQLTLGGDNSGLTGGLTANSGYLTASSAFATVLGAGTLTLNGSSNFQTVLDLANATALNYGNNTAVNASVLVLSDRGGLGATAGAGVTNSFGTLSLGGTLFNINTLSSSSGTSGLSYGATTLAGSSALISWADSATNLITLASVSGTSNLTVGGNGNVTVTGTTSIGAGNLTLYGYTNGATLTFTGTVSTTGNVLINGGTLVVAGTDAVIQGANSIIVNGGVLQLGSATALNVNRLGGDALTLAGGRLNLAGVTTANENETAGTLNLGTGYSTINGVSGGSKAYTITFANLGTVSAGATIDFMVAGGTANGAVNFTTSPTATGTIIIGGYATTGDDFAAVASGSVVAITGTTVATDYTSLSAAGSAANVRLNYTLNTPITFGASDVSVNSLNLSTSGTSNVNIIDLSNKKLTIGSGGILGRAASLGTPIYTITDGTLTTGNGTAPTSLYYTANNSQTVNLGATLANNGLTGTLSLVLAGASNTQVYLSAANTYTGQTFLQTITASTNSTYGTYIMTDRQFGAEPITFQADNIVMTNGALLKFTDYVLPTAFSTNRGITLASGGGVISFGSSNGATNFNTPITGTGPITFTNVQGGNTRVILSGANTYDGVTAFNYNNFYYTSIGNVGSTTPTSLGAPTTAANGIIVMNPSQSASGATFTGVYASTTDRIFITGSPSGASGATLGVQGAQLLTLNGNIFINNGLTLGSYGIGAQVNGNLIQLSTTASSVNVAGAVVRLSGMNDYKGVTSVGQAVLEFTTIGNIGSGPSSLGSPDTIANGTIKLTGGNGGAGNLYSTLRFTGTTAQSTDRPITANGNGTEAIETMSSAPITFTGGFSNQNGTFASALIFGGTGTGFFSGTGIIADNAKPISLTMQGLTGLGTWTLNQSQVNTFTAGLSARGGNLVLDYSNLATPTDLIKNTNTLTLGGGTLSFIGKGGATATSQTFASLSMSADTGSVLNLNANGGMGMSVITGAWTRATSVSSNFSTLNVKSTGTTSLTVNGTLLLNTNGIVDWMTYNDTDFATIVSGTATAYTAYQAFPLTTGSGTAVYLLNTGGTQSLVNNVAAYGLKIAGTSGTLNLGTSSLGNTNGQDFSIVFDGSNPYSIIGSGGIGNGNAAGLYISTAGANALTINAPLLNNLTAVNGRVVKTGSGTLILSGNNTYYDQTDVQYGTLIAGSNTGFSASSTFNIGSSGILATGANSVGVLHLVGNGIVKNGSTGSGTLTIGSNNTNSGNGFNGNSNDVFTGIIMDGSTGTLTLVKSGYGSQSLNNTGYNALNTYSGATVIKSGYLSVDAMADGGVASSIGTGNAIYLGSAGQLAVLQVNNVLTFNNESNRAIVLAAGSTGGIDVVNASTAQVNTGYAIPTQISGDFVGALLTLSGNISGAGTLAKFDVGTLDLTGTNTYTGGTVVDGGVMAFGSKASVPASGTITVKSGGTVGTDYAIDQAFLNQIDSSSTGVIALGADSSNNLDFTNLGNAALGAISHNIFTGTLKAGSNGYQLGVVGSTRPMAAVRPTVRSVRYS